MKSNNGFNFSNNIDQVPRQQLQEALLRQQYQKQRQYQQLKHSSGTANITSHLMLICGLILVLWFFSIYATVLFLFGMLPALIAAIVDQDQNRYLTKIMVNCNILGIMPYLVAILQDSHNQSHGIQMILNPNTWMVIYLIAAIGWVLYFVCPKLANVYWQIKIQNNILKLNTELGKIVEEWGDSIRKPQQPN